MEEEKKKNPGGRPTEWTQHDIDWLRTEFEQWLEEPTNFWFKDFILKYKLSHDILPRLAKRCPLFHATYRRAILNQEARLVKGGLFNITNSSMSMKVLACNHKWVDGTDTTGLEDATETKSTRALDTIKDVAIEHAKMADETSRAAEGSH